MISVISRREDPEKHHPVEISCSEQVQDPVAVDRIGTEFETAAFVAGVHDDCKQCSGAHYLLAVAGDLHSDHGAGKDHMYCFGDVNKFARPDLIEEGLEQCTVCSLTYFGVKTDSAADVKESYGGDIVVCV